MAVNRKTGILVSMPIITSMKTWHGLLKPTASIWSEPDGVGLAKQVLKMKEFKMKINMA